MKYLPFALFLMVVLITAGCVSEGQKTETTYTSSITQAPAPQSCVQITGETFANITKWVISNATLKNNCGDIVEGKIFYIAYERERMEYRGFVPQVSTWFTLRNSEEKTISTTLPDSWFSETVAVAREYGHGIVTSYDIKISVDKIGVDKPREAVVSRFSGESHGATDPLKVNFDPCGGYAKGWGNEC